MSATQMCMNVLERLAKKDDEVAATALGQVADRASRLQKWLEGGTVVGNNSLTLDLLKEDFEEALEYLTRAQALREGAKVIGR
jgi:hypothetical protein